MRKLQFNPNLDNSLSEYDTPRQEVTDPAYNCRNPVTAVQSGGEIIVGNNEQTVGDYTVSTECPYEAQGSSSYAYNYPPGLSNGLIIDNNSTQSGGGGNEGMQKVSNKRENYKPKPEEATTQQIQDIRTQKEKTETKLYQIENIKINNIKTKNGNINKETAISHYKNILQLYENILKTSPIYNKNVEKMLKDREKLITEFNTKFEKE